MLNKFKCCSNADLVMFLVRLALAAAFITHGVAKLSNMEGTVSFFASLGFSAFWAYLVSWLELAGGLLMLIGLWTCLAGTVLAIIMLMAIIEVKYQMGFLGGWELDLTLLLSSLAVVFGGPGKYSLGCQCPACKK